MGKKEKGQKNAMTEITRDHTLNLHKRIHRATFKNKAPRAISEIKNFARETMLTDDVRIDTNLNKFIWNNGVRNVPRKVRVRLSRKKNEEEGGKGQFFTLVEHIEVDNFDGLRSEIAKNKN